MHQKNSPDNEENVYATRTRIGSLWKEFVCKTTLHGLSHVQDGDRKLVSRIFWGTLVLAMISATAYVLISLLLLYREYPIRSVWNFRRETYLETPAFTICLCNPFDSKKVNKSKAAKKLLSGNWTIEDSDPEVQSLLDRPHSDFFNEFGFTKEDIIIEHLIYEGYKMFNGTKFVKRHIYEGRICFTAADMLKDVQSPFMPEISYETAIEFLIRQPKSRLAGGSFYDYFGNGLLLFIREHGTMGGNERPLLVPPGLVTYVLFSRREYHFLPQPYQSLGDENCVDTESALQLKVLPIYTRDSCIYELLQNVSSEVCGCVMGEFLELFRDTNISECSYRKYYDCFGQLWDDYKHVIRPQCPHACHKSTLEATLSSMPFNDRHKAEYFTYKDGENYIHLVFQARTTNIEIVRHEPEMSLPDIMATVGGFMGLLLGASLLTVMEWLEMFMTSAKLALLGWFRRK